MYLPLSAGVRLRHLGEGLQVRDLPADQRGLHR